MTDVLFPGLRVPVRFIGCPSLLRQAKTFFSAWPFEMESVPTQCPAICVESYGEKERGYDISAPWLNRTLHEPTAASALCSLSVELVTAFCKEHGMLCLHAAAAQMKGETLLLLGNNHAGKSSLIVRLMAGGCTSYGDDLIGMTAEGNLFSFGIAPRLRLPLPPSEMLHDFVQSHGGIGDDRYQYIKADTPLSAPFGHTAKPARIVLLQRAEKGGLATLSQQTGLLELLSHYIMQKGSAEVVFRQAAALTENIPVSIFRYDSLDEAFALLEKSLSCPSADIPSDITDHSRRKKLRTPFNRSSRTRQSRLVCYEQAPDIRIFSEYGRVFLTNSTSDALFALSSTGEFLWNMLKQPLSEQEAARLLQEVFPSIHKSRIQHDVKELFRSLKQNKLIIPWKDPAC